MIVSTRMILLAPIWGGGVMALSLIGSAVGPDLEIRFLPVLSDQVVGERWLTTDHLACFKWTYTKTRDPVLVGQDFVIEKSDGIRYPVDEWRVELGLSSNQSTTAKKGIRRTIDECVKIPKAMQGVFPFTMHGIKIYKPWLHPWELRQPLLSVSFTGDEPIRDSTSALSD